MDFSKIDFKTVDWKQLLTSFDGRIGREMFWVGLVAAAIVSAVIYFVAGMIARVVPGIGWLILLALQVVSLYPAAAVAMKRLHDRDKPDFWLAVYFGPYLVFLVLAALAILLTMSFGFLWTILTIAYPVAFLYMLYDLGWLEGIPGPNRHGSAPGEPPVAKAA